MVSLMIQVPVLHRVRKDPNSKPKTPKPKTPNRTLQTEHYKQKAFTKKDSNLAKSGPLRPSTPGNVHGGPHHEGPARKP